MKLTSFLFFLFLRKSFLFSDSLDIYYFSDSQDEIATASYQYTKDWKDLDTVSTIDYETETETYVLTADNQTGPFSTDLDDDFIQAVRRMVEYKIEFRFYVCNQGFAGGIDYLYWHLTV